MVKKKDIYKYPSVDAPNYSDEEISYRGYLIERLEKARNVRDDAHAEFDDMSYPDFWETNTKAGNSYIPPKLNPNDVRVVTGVTAEKVDTFVAALLNLSLEPNIIAYDKENREIRELGKTMEALINKSRELERPDYDSKRALIYREGAVQGDAFVEDVLVEIEEVGKKLTQKNWDNAMNMKKVWNEDIRVRKEIQTNLISGLNVYPGNINDFFIASQPYIFTREVLPYEQCDQIYKSWDRWKNVPAKINKLASYMGTDGMEFSDWALAEMKEGFVEVIKYYDKPRNEFQLILNGVMMLPIGFPLEALLGVIEYPIAKFAIYPISRHFFYSKGVASKIKVDQALLDEFYKTSIIKNRKSYMPPYINNTGKHLTSKIWMPANITDDVDPNRLSELGTNNGVTSPEFNMLQYIKQTIDNKSVSPTFEGQSPGGKQTATETVMLQKQSMQKLGLPIYGLISFEEELTWLRLYNLIQHWTKEEDTKVDKIKGGLKILYKRVEMDDTFDDGTNGKRIIEFTEKPQRSKQLLAKEKLFKKTKGFKVKITQLNPKELRNTKLNWEILIIPTPKDSDALDKAQFEESMIKGLQVFGPQALNMDYWKEQWVLKNNLDPDKALISAEQQQLMQQKQAMQAQQNPQAQQQAGQRPNMQQRARQTNAGNVNSNARQAVRGRQATAGSQQKPSLNTLVNA